MDFRVPKIPPKRANSCKLHAQHYLHLAKDFLKQGKVTKAYEYYAEYFDTLPNPEHASETEKNEYTDLVCEIGFLLEETDNMEELLKCYIKALNMFPKNYVILNCLGNYMYKINQLDIAKKYLEAACFHSNNLYLPAEKNLLYLKWYQMPRWHFRMMNDSIRNEAYYRGIYCALNSGNFKHVIDIGAGCGFLSYAAASKKGVTVKAVEENKTLSDLCATAMKRNELTNVTVQNANSTDIVAVGKKFDLLVTEIFDVALFGEHALKTIIHAHKVLLDKKNYRIVPSRAHVYVTGIESLKLYQKYKLCSSLNDIKMSKICVSVRNPDPYGAEYIKDFSVSYITKTKKIFHVNFYDDKQLNTIINDVNYKTDVMLECTKDGIIHMLVVWFSLDLGAGNIITTNPRLPNCLTCWEQAIFYLEHPIKVRKGDIYTVQATAFNNQLTLTLLDNPSKCPSCYKVSKEIVYFLNDKDLVKTIMTLAEKYTNRNLLVVDFNVFPLFGILLAKKGITVYYICKEIEDFLFIRHILNLNNINDEVFTILSMQTSVNNINKILRKADLVYIEPILTSGTLNKYPLHCYPEINNKVLPRSIKLNAVLINSPYIDKCNKVNENNTMRFKIADLMNEYTVFLKYILE